jgi:lipoprotein-releasing system permease protein
LAFVFGTMVLLLVLSVFNGFEGMVKDLYSTFYTDIKITATQGKNITLSPQQIGQLKQLQTVKNLSLIVEEKALLQNGPYQSVIYLKGVDDAYQQVSGVAQNLTAGVNYNIGTADTPRLIVGIGVEEALGIRADEAAMPIDIYLPRRTGSEKLNELEDISNNRIQPSASFRIQQDFDNKYGITHIDFVKNALRLQPNDYTAVEMVLKNPADANAVKRKIKSLLGDAYLVQNKYEQNKSLYAIMNLERWVIYGVLCLILVVAAFTMIGTLTMLVLEKQKDIGVLHALGSPRSFIQRIFLTEGMLIAVLGSGVGMLLAFIIAQLQMRYHLVPLQGGSFLIDYYPVKLRWQDFLLVGTTVYLVAIIAAWVPSKKAARQQMGLRAE